MGFTNICCYKNTFLMLKNVAQKIKKREAALKNEAGGDEKHLFFFFTWPKIVEDTCSLPTKGLTI